MTTEAEAHIPPGFVRRSAGPLTEHAMTPKAHSGLSEAGLRRLTD